jgi:hypothetical protein
MRKAAWFTSLSAMLPRLKRMMLLRTVKALMKVGNTPNTASLQHDQGNT